MWSFVNLTDLDINLPLDCKNIIWYLHTKIIMCKVVQPSILLFIFVQWIIPRIYTKIEKKYNPKIPLIKGIKRYAKRISFYICLRYEHKFVKWTGFIISVNYVIFFDVKLWVYSGMWNVCRLEYFDGMSSDHTKAYRPLVNSIYGQR